jgi:lipoprotein-anchoring transpeptidase ErfK/SrfK
MTRTRSLKTALTVLTIALSAALSACGGGSGPTRHAERVTTTQPTESASPIPREGSVVARSAADLTIFDAPADGAPSRVLPARTSFGSPRALLVEQDAGEWVKVALPVRPNGTTGWVKRADVELRDVDVEVHVDLAARRLTVLNAGTEVLSTAVAVGSPDVPTPTGRFFIVDKVETGKATSPYGPFALGLSAHSDVLTEFGGGDGQVAIHGTNDPTSIGRAVSHGCIRVPNEVVTQLADLLPLGTPVTVA